LRFFRIAKVDQVKYDTPFAVEPRSRKTEVRPRSALKTKKLIELKCLHEEAGSDVNVIKRSDLDVPCEFGHD
jgi:hypothetical protein